MAVDLFRSFQKMDKSFGTAAASTEMKTIEEQLLRILQSHNQQIQLDFKNSSASTSKPVVNRTGHARFRRGPSDPSTSSQSESKPSTPTKSNPNPIDSKLQTKISESEECKSTNTPISSGSSSITGEEGTVSNGKIGLLASVTGAVPRTFSAGKPPLPTSHRKRSREHVLSQGASAKHSISRGCHCCKRRKTVVKREIRRVTTEGSIPADKYSWKMYDQKLIPGTPFPRGYYKCNSAKGCPARKHVERTHGDPTVLIVTYEGEHRHRPETLTKLKSDTVGVLVESK